MTPNGSTWLQNTPNGSQWLQMARNNSKWLEMAPNGSKSVQLLKKMLKCDKMVPTNVPTKRKERQKIYIHTGLPVWLQMAPNGSKWLQMNPYG